MTTKVFAEVHDELKFSLNIYRGVTQDVLFEKFTHAFLPSQIEESYADLDGVGEIPGIKGEDGKWDTRGHRDRVMRIDSEVLAVIHALSEEKSVPICETRLIQPFSTKSFEVFQSISRALCIGRDITNWQQSLVMLEADSQKSGLIAKKKSEPKEPREFIMQGPHFHVGNPINKSARSNGYGNNAYDVVDLERIPDGFLPRANFTPSVSVDELHGVLPTCKWDKTRKHVDAYRIAYRAMINLNSERSLIAALVPPGLMHVNAVETFSTEKLNDLLDVYASSISIPFDFYIKASGRTHYTVADAKSMRFVRPGRIATLRCLQLSCLTVNYEELWNLVVRQQFPEGFSELSDLIGHHGACAPTTDWSASVGFRLPLARRMALIEVDVLVAQELGLTVDQLIEIYRVYFPVLQEYELGTWYDQQGRIVWTCSKGLPGVGWLDDRGKSPGRAAWEKLLAENPSELTCTAIDDTMPGGPREVTRHFIGPFKRCDRIEDYKRAWAHFERLKATEAA